MGTNPPGLPVANLPAPNTGTGVVSFLFGEVHVTAGRVEASAIWPPPDAVIRTPERRVARHPVLNDLTDQPARPRAVALGIRNARLFREMADSDSP